MSRLVLLLLKIELSMPKPAKSGLSKACALPFVFMAPIYGWIMIAPAIAVRAIIVLIWSRRLIWREIGKRKMSRRSA